MGFAVDFYNVPDRERPDDWAAARETEGWSCLGVGDHIVLDGRWALHSFACLGAIAVRTQHVKLATMFANNVVRSPVEFAQFALTLRDFSNGRFEAGIGAGWSAADTEAAGVAGGVSGPALARRYKEAVSVVRELFAGGSSFDGEFYNLNLPEWGPVGTPPSLFGAVGGVWGARHITPLVDRIEILTAAVARRAANPTRRAS